MARAPWGAPSGVGALLAAVIAAASRGTGPCSLCEAEVPIAKLRPPLASLPAFLLCPACAPLVSPPRPGAAAVDSAP